MKLLITTAILTLTSLVAHADYCDQGDLLVCDLKGAFNFSSIIVKRSCVTPPADFKLVGSNTTQQTYLTHTTKTQYYFNNGYVIYRSNKNKWKINQQLTERNVRSAVDISCPVAIEDN